MPKSKARTKPLDDLDKALLEVAPVSRKKKQEVISVPVEKKVKPKPKPKTKSKQKVESPALEIYELAALYEYLHRNTVTEDYLSWPPASIASATEAVKGINPADLKSMPILSRMYDNIPELTEEQKEEYKELLDEGSLKDNPYRDVREFQNQLIKKEIIIGMSIPLFIEHFKIDNDDPVILSLVYSWATYIRTMIERRKKQGNVKTRHASTVKEGDFCVEVECNVEQAKMLERYCFASHRTLIACRDHLKSLGNKAPKRLDKISSKLATEIRTQEKIDDVPRSLVVSALNGYMGKLKFDPSKEFRKDLDRFFLKDNFRVNEESITIGKAKDIAIRKVVGGKKYTTQRGMSVQRVTPLIYNVTIHYEPREYLEEKYGPL